MKNKIIKTAIIICMSFMLATPIICYAASNNKTNNVIESEKIIKEKEIIIENNKIDVPSRENFVSTMSEDIRTARKEQKELEEKLAKEKALAEEKAKAEKERQQNNSVQTPSKVSLGTFKLTAYCPCSKCCGKSDGITASGTRATQGRTIAVDTRVIPIGKNVIIDGNTYIAEDTGGAIKGNRIDVYFNSHQEALNFGIKYKEVFVYR